MVLKHWQVSYYSSSVGQERVQSEAAVYCAGNCSLLSIWHWLLYFLLQLRIYPSSYFVHNGTKQLCICFLWWITLLTVCASSVSIMYSIRDTCPNTLCILLAYVPKYNVCCYIIIHYLYTIPHGIISELSFIHKGAFNLSCLACLYVLWYEFQFESSMITEYKLWPN